MDKSEEEFLKRLKAMFQIEAEEHISILTSGLIELEKNPKCKKSLALIETIFREAHSLKGAARSVNRNDIESICQVLESTFAKLKNQQISFTAAQFDLIHKAIDTISKMVRESGVINPKENKELIKQLQSFTDSNYPINKVEEQPTSINPPLEAIKQPETTANKLSIPMLSVEEKSLQTETVRISTAKLDPLFLQAEQMIQSKVALDQRVVELKRVYESIGSWIAELKKIDSKHIATSPIHPKEIINWTNERLDEAERNLYAIIHGIENDKRSLGRMIDDHVESMKKILMLPISTIIEGFPRLVRDLARDQEKKVELIIHGEGIEVDKRILEELKDPLVHLMRNCIDHGIKKQEERLKAKKTSHGTLTLTFIVIDSRNLEISISDDGEGIDLDKVILSAIKVGVISKDSVEKISSQESIDLIFKSGITTSPMITDISGRGLGLAIVREKVEKLGGMVSVESQRNTGTTFRILLPLTLSTSRGVLVRTGDNFYFIPTANVERAVKINEDEIKTTENKETILLDQEIIAIVKLSNVLGLKDSAKGSLKKRDTNPSSNFVQIVVLKQGDKRIGFIVDEIFDEFQILVKKLGAQLIRIKNINGATILGSGKVVPVINVSDLMKSATRTYTSIKQSREIETETVKSYRILVIDDSITSRTLIKSIIESAGYIVETAVDGVDAFMKILVGEFDLIVSDVDMPRMNGFELTVKIRKEKKISDLPVVLVTALESRDDREHGIDVGANAYIIKSSFDQSNLLEVIEKLL